MRCDEQNSRAEEQADSEQGQPQRSRRLLERGRRVMLVLVLVLFVALRFVVRVAVATHAALIFGFPPAVKLFASKLVSLSQGRRDRWLDPPRARALG